MSGDHENGNKKNMNLDSSHHSMYSTGSILSKYSETTRQSKQTQPSQQDYAIADTLSRVVGRWRSCVVFMLLITAALVVTTTYLFLSDNEEREFQKSFEKSAKSIMDSIEFHATGAVQTFEALADSMTSEALTANATWPFFTSNNFEVKAAHARLNAFAECVMFLPIVEGDLRTQWESYSLQQASSWLRQSQALGNETATWLANSGFYQPATSSSSSQSNQAEPEEGDGNERRLQLQGQRKAITFHLITEDNKTVPQLLAEEQEKQTQGDETTNTGIDANTSAPSDSPTSTPTTSPSLPSPPLETLVPTQDPEFPIAPIATEIFLKGEDLPGGVDGDLTIISESWRTYYYPVWQISPPPKTPSLINYNLLADATSGGTFNAIRASGNK